MKKHILYCCYCSFVNSLTYSILCWAKYFDYLLCLLVCIALIASNYIIDILKVVNKSVGRKISKAIKPLPGGGGGGGGGKKEKKKKKTKKSKKRHMGLLFSLLPLVNLKLKLCVIHQNLILAIITYFINMSWLIVTKV